MKQIQQYYDQVHEKIQEISEGAAKVLLKQRGSIWNTLDKKLEDIKTQLKAEYSKKEDSNYDFKERERELNEHLETMTQIAQRIDDENRALMKKNAELKIEYVSQENDSEVLMQQLIQQKKEFQRLKIIQDEVKAKALAAGVSRHALEGTPQENQDQNQMMGATTKEWVKNFSSSATVNKQQSASNRLKSGHQNMRAS